MSRSTTRVTETVASHVSDAKARERAALERAQEQRAARQALGQVDQKLVQKTEHETHQKVEVGYDSTEQRGKRDAAREEAGVAPESRRVVAVADQMNGQDPTLAAAAGGKAQKTRARPAAPVQDRTRGR